MMMMMMMLIVSRDCRCSLSYGGAAGLVQSDETERLLHGLRHLLWRVCHPRLRPTLHQYIRSYFLLNNTFGRFF